MISKGYSILKHHGNWIMRWSVYRDGKRSQPMHILGSTVNYPKKVEVRPIAEAHWTRLRKSRTDFAGLPMSRYVTDVFFPGCAQRLGKGTQALYKQQWGRLEPYIGGMRLRDVLTPHVQEALDSVHAERGEEVGHDVYMHCKVTLSAMFSVAIRRGHHPGPNPENSTSVRGYGHTDHRENGAYDLNEIKQFITIFQGDTDVAAAIAINAFLALRKPEAEALMPEDFNPQTNQIRIHRHTKTGNDEMLPVIRPLATVLKAGWGRINMRRTEYAIRKALKKSSLKWRGWYAFRRGMLTNLWSLGVPVEVAAMILRNSPEVCRKHYLRLDAVAQKATAMGKLEAAYDLENVVVQ